MAIASQFEDVMCPDRFYTNALTKGASPSGFDPNLDTAITSKQQRPTELNFFFDQVGARLHFYGCNSAVTNHLQQQGTGAGGN